MVGCFFFLLVIIQLQSSGLDVFFKHLQKWRIHSHKEVPRVNTMLAFGLLWVLLLNSGVASAVLTPCGEYGDCPINQHCCGPPIGCWPNGQGCPPSIGEGSCPASKTVGGTCYVRYEDGVDTSQYGCTANCTYTKARVPGGDGGDDMFCFKQPGQFPVSESCILEGTHNLRIRKKLSSLNSKEKANLKKALAAAKKAGTYAPTWSVPNHNFSNGEYFNSSYNAAVAFHGYPGLCGGPKSDVYGAGCCIHGFSTFLPWHRLFMLQIEDALRHNETYKDITIPYWDWTQDFNKLPDLVADEDNGTNPFYHSQIPGISNYTERSAQALLDFNNFGCLENPQNCKVGDIPKYPDISKLGDMVLLALEEEHYESFEAQIEQPHNEVHNQLGFLPDKASCFVNDTNCYPYTMQPTYYAAYDPIFLIFHTMVDYQWAIFQALQKYRCQGKSPKDCPFSYENDCHPSFTRKLAPFYSDDYNQNEATKKHPTGQQVFNYTQTLGYQYDHLELFGRNISELDKFLKERGNVDRLFAGFSLPNMNIKGITFNLCFPITNCTYSSKHFTISRVNANQKAVPLAFQDKLLVYYEVTQYLSQFSLKASQDIGFKIMSSSIPTNVTFTPVSVFRKAKTQRDRITIHWRKDSTDYTYAPFFKTRPNPNNLTSLRFLLENGSMSVFQYPDRESFHSCSNATLVTQEIEIKDNQNYFLQNPLRTDCIEDKLQVSISRPCDFPPLHKYPNGDGIIGWQEDMSRYKDGICMEPGKNLTFEWTDGAHNVKRVDNQEDFENCNFPNYNITECLGANNTHPVTLTYPPDQEGFKLGEVYYMVCPCWGHCRFGMKLKIYIQEKCPHNIN